jgi:hypothetical protein
MIQPSLLLCRAILADAGVFAELQYVGLRRSGVALVA